MKEQIIKKLDLKNRKKRFQKKFKKRKIGKDIVKSKFESTEVVILLILTMLISVFVTSAVNLGINRGKNDISKSEALQSEELKNFLNNYNFIVENYFGEIDEAELLNNATKAILEALGDPFSNMIDGPSTSDVYLEGQFRGLGVEIINERETNNIIIIRVFPNSPADAAGLKAGDTLKSINNVNLEGKETQKLSEYVADNDGPFSVKVIREGEELEFEIQKGLVIIPSVNFEIINKNDQRLGYIGIDIFSETTLEQFEEKIQLAETENVDGLIIDLRGNSGGHLSVVYKMTSLLLEEGMVVYKTDDGNDVEEFKATGGQRRDFDIVFLSNGRSASASELMMAALRDNLGAKIIGETTYGKGTVQQIRESSSGSSYSITIKRWLTPNGDWVEDGEGGLVPDLEIELDGRFYETRSRDDDNQLKIAIDNLIN